MEMEQKAYLAMAAMLNAFPQGSSNPDLTMKTYEAVLRDASSESIARAAGRFCAGNVKDQNLKFAPSVAEFSQEVQRCTEYLELQARPRLPPPPKYTPGPLAPFQIATEKARAAHAHLPILFEDISFDQFRKMSAMRQIPTGATWVAALGIIYGPEIKQQTKAA